MTITSLSQLLKYHEGCRLSPYTCPAGFLTIGFGHNLDSDPIDGIQRGVEISLIRAEEILAADIAAKRAELIAVLPWVDELDDVRRAAMLDLAFNLGVAGLLKFTRTLEYVKAREYALARKALLQSRYATQVGKRARRIGRMLSTGQWPEV